MTVFFNCFKIYLHNCQAHQLEKSNQPHGNGNVMVKDPDIFREIDILFQNLLKNQHMFEYTFFKDNWTIGESPMASICYCCRAENRHGNIYMCDDCKKHFCTDCMCHPMLPLCCKVCEAKIPKSNRPNRGPINQFGSIRAVSVATCCLLRLKRIGGPYQQDIFSINKNYPEITNQ